MSSSAKQLCLWDAFGEYRCNATLSEANPFARPNPQRPDWELFSQQQKEGGEGSKLMGFGRKMFGLGGKGGNGSETQENFCGCAAGSAFPQPYSG